MSEHLESVMEGASSTIDQTRDKILHTLTIFPFLSRSMIHVGIGTSTPTTLWKPILDQLVAEGKVRVTKFQRNSPLDRSQSYTIYHLPENEYKVEPTAE